MKTPEEKLLKAAIDNAEQSWGLLAKELHPHSDLDLTNADISVSDFICGAKSNEAAAYHKEKNKWLDETEVRNLIMLWDSEGGVDWREVDSYFERNKKK